VRHNGAPCPGGLQRARILSGSSSPCSPPLAPSPRIPRCS
jgi:hypothetical protein